MRYTVSVAIILGAFLTMPEVDLEPSATQSMSPGTPVPGQAAMSETADRPGIAPSQGSSTIAVLGQAANDATAWVMGAVWGSPEVTSTDEDTPTDVAANVAPAMPAQPATVVAAGIALAELNMAESSAVISDTIAVTVETNAMQLALPVFDESSPAILAALAPVLRIAPVAGFHQPLPDALPVIETAALALPATVAVAAAPEPEDDADLRAVTATVLNMRAGPSSRTAVVGVLTTGDRATVLDDSRGGWVKIRAQDGTAEGWVFGKYLADTEAEGA